MRIEEINGDEVIYMRRTGQYGEENYELMCKMKAWSNERGLLTDDAVLFGIALDNPQFTKPSECRYDVCLLAPSSKDIATEDQVETRNLCGGKYTVLMQISVASVKKHMVKALKMVREIKKRLKK